MSTSHGSSEEWWDTAPYPGCVLGAATASGATEAPRQLGADDRGSLWQLDFHCPRGLPPLSLSLLGDLCAGAQRAARNLRVAGSGGLVARLVGPHVYLGALPVGAGPHGSPRDAGASDEAWNGFADEWSAAADELVGTYEHLGEALGRVGLGPLGVPTGEQVPGHAVVRELAQEQSALREVEPRTLLGCLAEAREVHAKAWQVHFSFMYRLLAHYRSFATACGELGIGEDLVPVLLQGEDTSVLAADRQLWELARAARAAGLEPVFRSCRAEEMLGVLASSPEGAEWASQLGRVLQRHGERSAVMLDVTSASWAEDPVGVLRLVAGHLAGADPAPARSAERREKLTARIAARMATPERRRFEELLSKARKANFVWWNEEHNTVIDLRAHLPLRRVALALGRIGGARDPSDAFFLTFEELEAVARGDETLASMSDLVAARREYHGSWLERRAEMPSVLGEGAVISDPVLVEILGAGHKPPVPAALPDAGGPMRGLGVSAGIARGRIRVVRELADLPELRRGEVMVCQATSPSWTPIFSRVGACVCEDGGMLTHAAIVSREYGVPCVCSVEDAMRVLRDGDVVEVDGAEGIVTILVPAP